MFDKWLFVLRNLATLLERPVALQERVFTRLFEAAEIAKFSKRELCEYEDSLKNFRDMYSVITTAELKGEAKGRAEGLVEGRVEGEHNALCRTASAMKERGLSPDTIADITGLSLEEIEGL